MAEATSSTTSQPAKTQAVPTMATPEGVPMSRDEVTDRDVSIYYRDPAVSAIVEGHPPGKFIEEVLPSVVKSIDLTKDLRLSNRRTAV